MKTLQIPLKDIEKKKIYYECANDLEDKTALSYLEAVESSSMVYDVFVPKNIKNYPICKIKEGDEREILKVYTNKFARDKSIGRKYYEAIMANANGRCSICGIGKLKNLDHFLPKSSYPLLCVTPANLIPVCRDCNFDKKTYLNMDYYSIPFNPYFDVMSDKWLECDINFEDDNTFVISYKNGYEKSTNGNLWKKYEIHFKVFDLDKTYSVKACDEMDSCKYEFKRLLKKCGMEGVKEALMERKDSCENNDINSWNSALYRELVRKVFIYCKWLDQFN